MAAYSFDDAKIVPLKNVKAADPQGIGECLEQVRAAHGGRLKAADVEAEAAKKGKEKHVIGRHLQWDDKKAGRMFRQDQVRELISIVRIVNDADPPGTIPKPAFLNVKDRTGLSYRSLGDVLTSSDMRLAVLQQAERDLLSWEQRYAVLSDICALVRTARSRVVEARSQLESRPG